MRQKKDHNIKPEMAGGYHRQHLRYWFRQTLGKRLLAAEQHILDEVMPNLFGYHLIQVGSPADKCLTQTSLIPNHVVIESAGDHREESIELKPQMVGVAHALPIRTDSVDVVLLAHTLESEQDAHQVLREADRVLVPEGHIVILGLNPWSLWGLWHLLISRWASPPWNGQFRSARRIKDWLSLLGYDTTASQCFFYRPPIGHVGVMRRLKVLDKIGRRCWPFAGAVYLIVGKKRMMTMTPLRPRWRPGRSLVGAGLVKPSAQRVKDDK